MSDRSRIGRGRAVAILLIVAAPVYACAEMKPDLLRIYRASWNPKRPVILIPGVFGSRLRDAKTGRVVWGSTASFIERLYRPFHPDRDLLDLPIDAVHPLDNHDGLEPAGVFDKVAGREYYLRVLNTLRDAGGFTPGDIHNPRPGEDLFAFDYDWRRDAAEAAGELAKAIDRVLEARGDPNGRVDLIGHSLGGLLARYFVRFGGRDVLDQDHPAPTYEGAGRVGTVVFVGTPNAGTLDALRSLLEGERVVRLLPPEAIFTMPAAYELLPEPGREYLLDAAGAPLPDDIFDVATWEKLGWSVFNPDSSAVMQARLRKGRGREEAEALFAKRMDAERRFASWALGRARRFREALSGERRGEAAVRYVAFGGDCLKTPARAVVLFDGATHTTYFDPDLLPSEIRTPEIEELMSEPGDGAVTRASLLGYPPGDPPDERGLPIASSWFLCETHKMITQSVAFHDNLLHALLQP